MFLKFGQALSDVIIVDLDTGCHWVQGVSQHGLCHFKTLLEISPELVFAREIGRG